MSFHKSTKGTHVYKANEDDTCYVSMVYIQREELPKNPPQEITLTISFEQ